MWVHDHLDVRRRDGVSIFVVRRTRTNEALIALILCVGLGWIPVALVPTLIPRVLIAIGVAGVAFFAIRRAFRIRIEADRETVAIFNYWRSYQMPWSRVRRIGLAAANQGVLLQRALGFELNDGKIVCAQGTPRNSAQRERLVAQLRSIVPGHVEWYEPLKPTGVNRNAVSNASGVAGANDQS